MATGSVFIEELAIECVVGVHAWERVSRQRLLVSLSVETDFAEAAAGDDIRSACDYVALSETARRVAQGGRYKLLETLAEAIAEAVLTVPEVDRIGVRIAKPAALRRARAVGVQITRSRT